VIEPASLPHYAGRLTARALETMKHLAAGRAEADKRAYVDSVVEDHFDFIWRMLRRWGLSAPAADDAAQQVFLIAMQSMQKIRAGKERSFLFGTALRVAAVIRRQRAREVATEALDPSDPAPLADELANQKRLRDLFDGVLEAMPEDLRTVLVLVEVEGLTVPEVRDLLDVPVGTASSRLRRAREEFHAAVKRIEARERIRGGLR